TRNTHFRALPAQAKSVVVVAVAVVVAAVEKEGQDLGVFLANGAKLAGVYSQGAQDTGSHLRGGNGCLDGAGAQGNVRDDEGDVRVAETKAPVLGVLLFGTGVNGAVDGLHDDVGRTAVVQRIEEFESQLLIGHHFFDEKSLGVGGPLTDSPSGHPA